MKRGIIFILLSVTLVFYLGYRLVWYGSLTRSCIHTEEHFPVPDQLAKGELMVAKDAYLAKGYDPEYSCLQDFGRIDKEIVNPEEVNNITVGRRYFIDRGLTVESLKKGTSFRVVDIIAVSEHGISTIDSGGGPTYYLILKDRGGAVYQMATVSLGMDESDLFMSFVDLSKPSDPSYVELLGLDSFGILGNPTSYTGKLVRSNTVALNASEPQWKKLADRLERGEKFFIFIEIALRDDSFQEIKLSDDPTEHSKQVVQAQDEFLKKIPSNLILKSVEKNAAWPYISMEANLDLLNYFVDRQVELKIKTMSELIKK